MDTKERRKEAWRKAWDYYIVNENPPSFEEDGTCMYNGPKGTKCAFAIQLTDEELAQIRKKDLEGEGAVIVIELLGLKRFYLEDRIPDPFYNALQGCHDGAAKQTFWGGISFRSLIKDGLLKLASRYKLDVEVDDAHA